MSFSLRDTFSSSPINLPATIRSPHPGADNFILAACTFYAIPEIYNFIKNYSDAIWIHHIDNEDTIAFARDLKNVFEYVDGNEDITFDTIHESYQHMFKNATHETIATVHFLGIITILHNVSSCKAVKIGTAAHKLEGPEADMYSKWMKEVKENYSVAFLLFITLTFDGKQMHISNLLTMANYTEFPLKVNDFTSDGQCYFLRLPKYMTVIADNWKGMEGTLAHFFGSPLDMRDAMFIKYRNDNPAKFVYNIASVHMIDKVYLWIKNKVFRCECNKEITEIITTKEKINTEDIWYVVYARDVI